MTVDGFLTFLSLLIAAAALASSGTRMRMSLLWGLPALSGILAFLLVIYLQLFDRFGVQCPDFMGQGCEVLTLDQHTVTAQELSFFIVIAWLVLALGLSARRRISIKGLPKLEKLVGRLLSDKQFSQAADLIEPNLELIIDVISNKTRVQRLRRYFETRRPDTLAVLAFLQHEEGQKVRTQWDRILSPLQHLLPGIEKQREAALSLYHQVTASNEFIEYAALARLSLGLKLMTAQIWKSEEYTEKFFDALMSEKDSAFYADQMQRMPPRQKSEDYGVHTPLYSFLFNDAHVANDPAP
ncbi:hypothetical protein [Henriciella aquimarina]|uniref:hypothetical protein n=1 Tax=Henriciella aquimarina TaxID=545261 RepID=UPI00117AD331|nr:hypothetical protein [Henriciella aquimarina]